MNNGLPPMNNLSSEYVSESLAIAMKLGEVDFNLDQYGEHIFEEDSLVKWLTKMLELNESLNCDPPEPKTVHILEDEE